MKLRARLLAAFAVVLTVAAGVSLLVTPIPLRDRLLAFGVVIVVGLVIAFAVAEMLARPLGDLSETASRVAKGDLTARAHARSDDELGALAASLNEIVENLRAQTTEADTSRDEVRRSVRRLGEAPVRDARGAPQPINHGIPDGSERADVLAAVPARTTD